MSNQDGNSSNSDNTSRLHIHQTRIGLPEPLGNWNGHDIVSAIAKEPAFSDSINVHTLGLEGDGQSNLKIHGGVDKALYAYPVEHYAYWNKELGTNLVGGAFGENLVVEGLLENKVYIGDVFQWGDVLVQVTKPRQPCYKLIMHCGVEDIIQRMRANGRTGWYLRVLKEGVAPTSGVMQRLERASEAAVNDQKNDGQSIAENYLGKTAGPINPDFFGPQ